MSPSLDAILGLLALLLLAVGIASALRAARFPGAAVLGGVIAGVILGPTLLGRIVPMAHERAFVGAVAEREHVDSLRRELDAWQFALQHAGPPDPSIESDHTAARDRRLEAIAAAETVRTGLAASHARPFRWLAATLLVLTFATAGRRSTARPGIAHTRGDAWSDGGWAIGAWSAAVCGTAGIAIAALGGEEVLGPAALTCAAALAVGSWRLPRRDLRIALDAEHEGPRTVRLSSRVACAIGCALLTAAAWRGGDLLVLFVSIVALACVAWPFGFGLGGSSARPLTRSIASSMTTVTIPVVAALASVRIEIFADARLAPLVLLPLVSGDGRWVGGMVGALLLGGRGPGIASRLLLVLAAAAPTQLAVTALGLWSGLLPRPIAMGLVVGALLTEVTATLRRSASLAAR